MDTLKRSTKWAMTSSDRRASSEKAFFKQNSKEKVISKGVKSTAKICQGNLFRVTVLKGSTKRAIYSSFCNAPYTKPSTSKSTLKM